MENSQKLQNIRAKKLGILLQDARVTRHMEPSDCAAILNISTEAYAKFETGTISPSLPQIEILAFFLDIPIAHFWQSQLIENELAFDPGETLEQLLLVRNKIIGTNIRITRQDHALELSEVAEMINIPIEKLISFESGKEPIPLPHLESIASLLDIRLETLISREGAIGNWYRNRIIAEKLGELPDEMVEFVSKPINEPYLRLALHLSDMEVQKLRTIAEGLLEITL